jgi:glycosyltransferase involved in cell wall biosynthesis
MQLTVIIPARDAASDLPGQLEALSSQRWDGEFEVLVVDNGSNDDTVEVAKRFQTRFAALRVVEAGPGGGQARARNMGAREATGDELVFLDADDVADVGYLEAVHRALQEHALVAARLDCDALNPEWARRSRPPAQVDSIGTPSAFCRRRPVAALQHAAVPSKHSEASIRRCP